MIKNFKAWLAARTREDGDCLLWTLAIGGSGIPTAGIKPKRTVNVRRLYVESKGIVLSPTDVVMPSCRNPRCLSHAVVVNRSEVNRIAALTNGPRSVESLAAGRERSRARATAVRSMEVARRIRALRAAGRTYAEIESETGVSWRRCYDVCANRAWKEHAPGASVFCMR